MLRRVKKSVATLLSKHKLLVSTFLLIGVLHVKFFLRVIGRAFTPILIEFYNAVNESEKKFEVVFLSLDNDPEEYKEYSESMPWKALPYKDAKIQEIASKFKIGGVPTLIIIKKDGNVATINGRADVSDKGPDVFDEWISK